MNRNIDAELGMRGAGILLLFLLSAAALVAGPGAAQDAPDAYFDTQTLAGRLECGASAAGVSTEDQCNAADSGAVNAFTVAYAANLRSALFVVEWQLSNALQGKELRVEFSPTLDEANTQGAEGISPINVKLAPIQSTLLGQAGKFVVTVVPPEASTDPSFTYQQDFTITYTLGYTGLPPGLGKDLTDPGDEPTADNPVAPGSDDVGAKESFIRAAPWRFDDVRVLSLSALATAALPFVLVPRARHAVFGWIVPLFSRLDQGDVVDHPRRALILSLVRVQPGLSAESARRRLGLANGAFEHHLRILSAHRLVRRIEAEGHVMLYPADSGPRASPSNERQPIRLRILDAVRTEPGLRQVDLSQRLGVPEKNLRYHALQMARRGQLRLVPEGRAVRCYPLPA